MLENRDNFEQYKANAEEMIRAIDNTGIRMFMYFPQTKTITVPEKTCEAYQCKPFYDNMPHSFADDYVNENDYAVFKEMYYKIDRGEKTATAVFHSKDYTYCNHVTLTTVSWFEDGSPDEVFGLIEDMSALYKNEQYVKELKSILVNSETDEEIDEALKTLASSISLQYFAVYYIWLESKNYVCFQEQMKGIISRIGIRGQYDTSWDIYISEYIDEADREKVKAFGDLQNITERIGHKMSISCDYRRKESGWTRGQFIVGKRDENGKPLTLIYTVSDINEEVETKKQKQEAEQETLHDAMTRCWNRKAFDQYKRSDKFKNKQAGLLLFDIDRFKSINDQYGHEVGDQVIKIVSEQVNDILRQEDMVFRVGGDEFAVLLYDCNENVWNSACRKISQVHYNIKDALPKDMNVTISAGLCINRGGYIDEMYALADQALYHTKATGRCGCTFVNLEGSIRKEWHDKSSIMRMGDVLEKNSTMTWSVEMPKQEGGVIRTYGDDLFLSFLGVNREMPAEKIFKVWLNGVVPDYMDILKEALKATLAGEKAEVVYLWNHPQRGIVQLRCSFSLEGETDEYYSIIGYIHITEGTHVFTINNISDKIRNALEEMYFRNFYIRLSDYSFKVYKAQPYVTKLLGNSTDALDAIHNYVQYMVAEESREAMAAFFDLTTLRQRMRKNNILVTNYKDKNVGNERAKFVVVNRDEYGEVESVALIVEENE